MLPSLRAVSLFSNCGAGDVGFAAAGFEFVVLAEIDPRRLTVAGLNHRRATTVVGDLRATWKRVVQAYRGATDGAPLDLLAACPPCQGMSSANGDRGLEHDADAGSLDARNLLVEPIAKVARALAPKVIVIENVPAFLSRKVRHPRTSAPVSAAALLVERLRREYEVYPVLVDLAEYGVPQTRKRAFLTFVRRGLPGLDVLIRAGLVPYPAPTHVGAEVTLAQALVAMQLPPLDAASDATANDPTRPLHCVPVWAGTFRGGADRYRMVHAIPTGGGASAWTNDRCAAPGCDARTADPEAAVCGTCGAPLPRPVVRDRKIGAWRLVQGFRSSSYRRMRPDRPAATVTTASGHVGSDLTIHPTQHRVLSPLECQLLQTLPPDFSWGTALVEYGHTFVREMIGEAVPPRFTEQHGRALAAVITASPGAEGLPGSASSPADADQWPASPAGNDVGAAAAAGRLGLLKATDLRVVRAGARLGRGGGAVGPVAVGDAAHPAAPLTPPGAGP